LNISVHITGCAVFMATGLLRGKGEILTPCRINTPQLIAKIFVIKMVIMRSFVIDVSEWRVLWCSQQDLLATELMACLRPLLTCTMHTCA